MHHSKRYGFPTHGDCANFRSGFCALNGTAVDPGGAACQKFTPKSPTPTPQIGYGSPPIAYPPQAGYAQSAPQYTYSYIYPPPYALSLIAWYRHRTHYRSGPSSPNPFRQSDASFRSISRDRGGGGGGRGSGRGRGRMGGFAAGPGGFCVCPSCGYKMPHGIGTPCYQQTCPKCGSRMTRSS